MVSIRFHVRMVKIRVCVRDTIRFRVIVSVGVRVRAVIPPFL